ncbi:MAG: hypothetical protein V4556_04990 [Bacteroidota bacterium]
MRNPIYNKKHVTEYIIYGLLSSFAYIIVVDYFLYNNKYENFYYVYLGNLLFMFGILLYVVRLLNRPYDGKSAGTMMIAGIMATLTGIVLSCILILISMLFFFPDLFSAVAQNKVIENAPETIQAKRPGELLLMLLLNAIIANFGVGAFISVVVAYAGKKDQRKDRTESLDLNVPNRKVKAQ